MNIAIDTAPLGSAHARRGTGSYTRLLIDALTKYEKRHSYMFFTGGQQIPDNADLVHYPYFDPFFLTLPLTRNKPVVVTIHDVIPLIFPDKFPPGLRGAIKWRIQKMSLRGSKRIITDSLTSKRDITRITGFLDKQIDVIYLAPNQNITRIHDAKAGAPFILYVGDVNWNKNIPDLLKALVKVPNIRLVLVGSAFTDGESTEIKEINSIIGSLGIGGRITRSGHITNKELSTLYSTARCLVMPSLYEGFGLPVLDAMQSGCPVVVADTSSLHEIAGPAIKVHPDPSGLAEGLNHVLHLTPNQRKQLVDAQTAWVAKFSWEKVAHDTVKSYEKSLL